MISAFRRALGASIACAVLASVGGAGVPAVHAAPTAAQVVDRLLHEYEGLRDYQASLLVRVLMPYVDIPDMPVTAYWRAPDRTAIRARGLAIIPEQGVFLLPTVFGPDRFTPMGLRVETVSGAERYHIQLKPRPGTFSKFARGARATMKDDADKISDAVPDAPVDLWIDPKNWTITRAKTEVKRADGGTDMVLDARMTYGTYRGYKLPSRTVVHMTLPEGVAGYSVRPPGRRETKAAPSGPVSGKVIMTFSNYRVNRGIPDEVFTASR